MTNMIPWSKPPQNATPANAAIETTEDTQPTQAYQDPYTSPEAQVQTNPTTAATDFQAATAAGAVASPDNSQ